VAENFLKRAEQWQPEATGAIGAAPAQSQGDRDVGFFSVCTTLNSGYLIAENGI
jgi:hypothetical protein